MDRTLLKEVVRRIQPMRREIVIPGYSHEEIQIIVDELIQNNVISPIKSTNFIPNIKNGTIREGTQFPSIKTEDKVGGYEVWESKLKEIYKMDRMGNDIK